METTITINNRKFVFKKKIEVYFSDSFNYIKLNDFQVKKDQIFLEYITDNKLGYITEGYYPEEKVVWITMKKGKIHKFDYKLEKDSIDQYYDEQWNQYDDYDDYNYRTY